MHEASDDGNWLDAGRPRTGRAGLEGEGEEGNASRVLEGDYLDSYPCIATDKIIKTNTTNRDNI